MLLVWVDDPLSEPTGFNSPSEHRLAAERVMEDIGAEG